VNSAGTFWLSHPKHLAEAENQEGVASQMERLLTRRTTFSKPLQPRKPRKEEDTNYSLVSAYHNHVATAPLAYDKVSWNYVDPLDNEKDQMLSDLFCSKDTRRKLNNLIFVAVWHQRTVHVLHVLLPKEELNGSPTHPSDGSKAGPCHRQSASMLSSLFMSL
jgi:hypothetical protein